MLHPVTTARPILPGALNRFVWALPLVLWIMPGCSSPSGPGQEGGPRGDGSTPSQEGGVEGGVDEDGAAGDGAVGDGGVDAQPGDAALAGDAETVDPPTPYERCIQHVESYCGVRARCGYDATSCLEDRDFCPDLLFAEGSSLDFAALDACDAAHEAMDCVDLRSSAPYACAAGEVAVGEACTFDSQCESMRCSGGPNVCGTCEVRVAEGMPCTAFADCEKGLFCDNTCVADAPDRWKLAAEGEECGEDDDCLPSFVCAGDASADPGVCTAPAAVNEPCTLRKTVRVSCGGSCEPGEGGVCETGAYCEAPVDVDAPAFCRARPSDGQPCGVAVSGNSICERGLACITEGAGDVCRPREEGDQCFGAALACGESMFCTSIFGQCAVRAALGDDCPGAFLDFLGTQGCEIDLVCQSDSNICVQEVGLGDACDDLHVCPAALECVSGTCQIRADGYFEATCAAP